MLFPICFSLDNFGFQFGSLIRLNFNFFLRLYFYFFFNWLIYCGIFILLGSNFRTVKIFTKIKFNLYIFLTHQIFYINLVKCRKPSASSTRISSLHMLNQKYTFSSLSYGPKSSSPQPKSIFIGVNQTILVQINLINQTLKILSNKKGAVIQGVKSSSLVF